jgi:hypothetical protein
MMIRGMCMERTKKHKGNKDRKNTHIHAHNDATVQKRSAITYQIIFRRSVSWREPRSNVLSRPSSKSKPARRGKLLTASSANIFASKVETVISFETSLNFSHTTWRHSQNVVLFKKNYFRFQISSYILQIINNLRLVTPVASSGS